ncbi:MAG: hypothetical protein AAF662_05490 [Pseudomonadota bacterium]
MELRDRYLALVLLEVEEFGVKATEVRHLIGRLGEFECALQVNGELAHVANQHGFDVVAPNGRKISVKSTAQKTGFISLSESTTSYADDLVIFQYCDGLMDRVFYGPIDVALAEARSYRGKFELDLVKARRLGVDDLAK